MKEISDLINKVLLIGITFVDEHDELVTQIQVYGPIVRVNAEGIVILRNGLATEFTIPPDFAHLSEAQPGEYRLSATGEVVVNPDYISSWTVNSATPESIDEYEKFGFRI